MTRHSARERVNAALDRRPPAIAVVVGGEPSLAELVASKLGDIGDLVIVDRPTLADIIDVRERHQPLNVPALFGKGGAVNAIAAESERIRDMGLTMRDIEKRDRRVRFAPAQVPDHFGDEGLTLAQKRRREEALSHGD